MAFTQNSPEYQAQVDQFLKAKANGADVSGIQKQAQTSMANNYQSVNIGGKNYSMDYVNNPANQEEIRQANVNSGGNVSVVDYKGNTYDNVTGNQIQPSIADMIKSQSDAQKASMAAQLQGVRDQANAGYNKSINGLQGTYQPLRDSQDFQGAKNIQGTNEQMANMGITNSGDAITAQIQNRVGNENSINKLNTQQQGDKTNFENLIAQANNSYNSNLASSNAGIDAQALSQLITQSNSDRAYNADQAQNTFNNNIATAGLTGTYNGTQTMQGANNASQLIGSNLNNDYQGLVNAGYPAQQANAMALAKSQLTGSNLQNDYQTLLNAGYPAKQAADLAQQKAQTAGQLLNNTGQSIQNQYMPQQLQSTINASNRSNTGGSGSGGGSRGSGGSSKPASQTTIKDTITAAYNKATANNEGSKWLAENKTNIINSLNDGEKYFVTLTNRGTEAETLQNSLKEGAKTRAQNYNMQPM